MNRKIELSIPFEFARNEFIADVTRVASELGLSLQDVSQLAGLTRSYMAKLIDDKRSNLELRSLLGICNALDIDPRKYFVLEA